MYKQVLNWEACGTLFIFILGALLHFVYDWSGQWKPAALIAPVNESVWEHLKMVLWPALAYAAIEYNSLKGITNNFWTAKLVGILSAMALIIIIFYLYTSIIGHNILIADILTFLVSVAIGQYLSYKTLTLGQLPGWINRLSTPLLFLIVLSFVVFTFSPPRLPVFKNPVDGTYGA